MDRSSPSVARSTSAVSAALIHRTSELTAEIYGLIVREIPQLRTDQRVLTLLEASVRETWPPCCTCCSQPMAGRGRLAATRLNMHSPTGQPISAT